MFKKKVEEPKKQNKKVDEIKENNIYVVSKEVINGIDSSYVLYHLSDGTDSLINPNK